MKFFASGVKRKALLCTIALVLLCAVFVGFFAYTLKDQSRRDKYFFAKGDFTVFYVTAKAAFDGKDMYDSSVTKKEIARERGSKGAVRYLYAPLVLVLFFPLTVFTHNQAMWIWFGVNMVCIGALVFLTLYLVRRHTVLWQYAAYLGMISVFTPIVQAVSSGQVNILVACLLLLYVLFFGKRPRVAAVFLAVIIFIKLFPLALLGYHVFKKQWKFAAQTVAALCVLAVCSIALFGWQAQVDYVKRATHLTLNGIGDEQLQRKTNETLNGVLYRQFVKNAPEKELPQRLQLVKTIRYSLVFVVGVALMVLTYLNRRAVTLNDHITEVSMWISFVLFGASDIHLQYFTFLLPFLYLHLTYTPFFKKILARILLGISFVCIALSASQILHIPRIHSAVSIGFIGNCLFLLTVAAYYYYYQLKGKRRPHGKPSAQVD